MEIVSRSFQSFKPRTAEAIEEIVSRAPSNVRAWAARELKKGRVPSSDYDALLPTLQRIADRGNFWEKTWKEAAGVQNWAYLNGRVHFADRPFEALRALAEGEGNQEAKALANHWLAGNTIIPPGHKDAIAHGELTPDGHVLFLNTNADRNQVRDAVLQRTAAGIGPIQRSPYGPSAWSPEGQRKRFTVYIGNTSTHKFLNWLQQAKPEMLNFIHVKGGVGVFQGQPEGSTAIDIFDTPLPAVKQFLDFYGKYHPEEWGFGLDWGHGSQVYRNKFNDDTVADADEDTLNKSMEPDDQAEVGVNKGPDWAEEPNQNQRAFSRRHDDWMPVREAKADLNGTMVSLDVPKEHQGQLAVRGGERPHNLHCTLAYMPNGVKDHAGVARLLNDVAGKFGPQKATIKKLDQFDETKDKDIPHIALLEGDQLHDMATAVRSGLKALGEEVNEKFDFKPHITIAYKKPDEEFEHPNPELEGSEINFPSMHLHQAGDIQEFQLGKQMAYSSHGPMGTSQDDDWMIWK